MLRFWEDMRPVPVSINNQLAFRSSMPEKEQIVLFLGCPTIFAPDEL